MRECNFSTKFINFFIFIYILITLILLYFTPFTHSEANILFSTDFTIEHFITNNIYKFFKEYFVLRLPFFIISIASLLLYKEILKSYFKYDKYYNLSILFFLLTPGIFLSFILVNYATIPIFLTLFLIYSYKKDKIFFIILALVLLFFTHSAQFVVYIALILYAYREKKWFIVLISIILILFASVSKTYPIDGIPKGHLIQLFGIYAAIFSPLLFLASIFAIYKVATSRKKDLLWYISTTAFTLSIILSIRQKIKITDFSPYFVIITPLVVSVYKNSIEIRLKDFRKGYYLICKIVLIVLLLETSTIAMHYVLYKVDPSSKFILDKSIYKIPNEVNLLKKNGKKCKYNISNKEKALYKYYNISKCN